MASFGAVVCRAFAVWRIDRDVRPGRSRYRSVECVSRGAGTAAIAESRCGVLVLLLWVPLRQKPGLGTISNVIMIGLAADAALAVLPAPSSLALRGGLLVAAVVLNALATGMYIGAGFGAGPRDGLMTGINARTGWSVRSVRTAIEITVLLAGWAMGGTLGIGTVVYALAIGPLIQLCLPWFQVRRVKPVTPAVAVAEKG